MKAITHWMFTTRIVTILASCLLTAAFAQAQTVDVKTLAEAMKQGGYVIVLRHGATNRDQADTDPFNLENVTAQRLLSEDGKELAKQVGESFKTLGIPLGKVYSSMFNRAEETAKLISSSEVIPTLEITEGGLVVTPIENDRRAEALRMMVATRPEDGTNTLIVTHKPNIIEAFGKDWFDVKEGEASIFLLDSSGKATLVARVQASDWVNALK
jgi:phosphohistidine phosphatase SixA